jgi:hypothetical protein
MVSKSFSSITITILNTILYISVTEKAASSKLEKAEILKLTVDYVKYMQKKGK